MSAVGAGFTESRSATSTPITVPIMAGMMIVITIIATIITNAINAVPIRIIFTSLLRDASLATKGYFRPLTSHERKSSSIIQLIVRNVKQIFIRIYILQIAVLIAASGAFGDQIK